VNDTAPAQSLEHLPPMLGEDNDAIGEKEVTTQRLPICCGGDRVNGGMALQLG